jgi:hypothetical protein
MVHSFQRKPVLTPGKELENALRIINGTMNYAGVPYWLCFGGLWALIQNNGVVPDGDLDLCTYYGQDYKRVAKAFEGSPGRYKMMKAVVDDTNGNALYCHFVGSTGLPHICLSFWYLHDEIRYYCHDQHHEVEGTGSPKSGFYFRGIPAYAVHEDPENFRMSEWPGINQATKVRVPRFPGVVLDNLYPDWAYRKQRYEVKRNQVIPELMASYHKGGAISPYAVHVQSMKDWQNGWHVKDELEKAKQAWIVRLKNGK